MAQFKYNFRKVDDSEIRRVKTPVKTLVNMLKAYKKAYPPQLSLGTRPVSRIVKMVYSYNYLHNLDSVELVGSALFQSHIKIRNLGNLCDYMVGFLTEKYKL